MFVDIKTREELTNSMQEYLENNTSITYFGDGSIARALLEAVNEEIEGFYEELDFNMTMSFVSTARGNFLDLIGRLLDCERRTAESDENFRYRITNQVYKVAGANITAVRLSCLSVDNVKDLSMRPHTRGAGTFTMYVDMYDWDRKEETLEIVRERMEENQGFGIMGEVLEPNKKPVDLIGRVHITESLDQVAKNSIRRNCARDIERHISTINTGESINASQVIRAATESSDHIIDFKVDEFYIDDEPRTFSTKSAEWDEQFVPGEIEVR